MRPVAGVGRRTHERTRVTVGIAIAQRDQCPGAGLGGLAILGRGQIGLFTDELADLAVLGDEHEIHAVTPPDVD